MEVEPNGVASEQSIYAEFLHSLRAWVRGVFELNSDEFANQVQPAMRRRSLLIAPKPARNKNSDSMGEPSDGQRSEFMDTEEAWDDQEQSKSAAKRECHRLTAIGEELLKLRPDERRTLELPETVEDAIEFALTIKSRGAAKRQRLTIGKLLRSMDPEWLEDALKLKQLLVIRKRSGEVLVVD